MWLCTLAITSLLMLIIIYNVTIWILLDFNPFFFYIDSCMDLGGRWNYDTNDCEGSEKYNEWKERTIW